MGYSKILWVYEDGVRAASDSQETWDKLRPVVGDAVLKVCTEVVIDDDRISAHVLNYSNCVNLCDEAHSTEAKLYLWAGNCLRPITKLNDESFAAVEQLVRDEAERRKAEA